MQKRKKKRFFPCTLKIRGVFIADDLLDLKKKKGILKKITFYFVLSFIYLFLKQKYYLYYY